jgi:2-polyprenyl-3-methyl-5-hydroxy-6-metoxy-1,4-benzoquinol methylase
MKSACGPSSPSAHTLGQIARHLAYVARGSARLDGYYGNNIDAMTNHSETTSSGSSSYKLGHADAEVQRLLLQGRIYNDHTENALRMAGLRSGMRVLDVGCGPGDVSIVASRLVGPTGTVLAVDSSPRVIELARSRAAELSGCDVQFEVAAVQDIALDEPVDAVIGRLILMHLHDPVATLRHLAGQARRGGILVFGETDITLADSLPAVPLWRIVKSAIQETFSRMGLDPAFGRNLPTLFRRAGLKMPQLTLGAPLGGAHESDVLTLVAYAWRSVYPMAQQLGTVTGELTDVDTVFSRLREESASNDAILMLPPLITAWTRV